MAETILTYCNGEYRDSSIGLPTDDPGFVWGATVTDRFRTYHGRPFRLQEHLQRFEQSASACHILLPHSPFEITSIIDQLLDRWHSRREGGSKECVGILWATPRTFVVELRQIDPRPYAAWIQRGARLRTSGVRPLNPGCVPRGVKMRSRMHWWIAEQQVRAIDPSAIAVLSEDDGRITETAIANVLIVRENRLISPPRESILEGVSLQVVRELCERIGMNYEEKSFTRSEILDSNEVILTSTAFGVCGVSEWDGRPQLYPGKSLRALHQAWSEAVGLDIWADFLAS